MKEQKRSVEKLLLFQRIKLSSFRRNIIAKKNVQTSGQERI